MPNQSYVHDHSLQLYLSNVENLLSEPDTDFRYLATTNLMGDQGTDHVARIARFSMDAVKTASVRPNAVCLLYYNNNNSLKIKRKATWNSKNDDCKYFHF